MHLFITGASGLIGKKLCIAADAAGHTVTKLVRSAPQSDDERQWDPQASESPKNLLDGCEGLIHLAGENIGEGRWTEAKKERIVNSRIHSTNLLATHIAAMSRAPKVFIVANAIGFYGDRGDEVLTEESEGSTGFLPDLCRDWEQATQPAKESGIRTISTRVGVVLSPDGGALSKMYLPFKLGLGGRMGSGQQYWSWITLHDIVRVLMFIIENDSVSGPVNVVTPNPVTNAQFTRAMGTVLNRPTIFPMPAFMARLIIGEAADPLILCSARVLPSVLEGHGFQFDHPELEFALRSVLQ